MVKKNLPPLSHPSSLQKYVVSSSEVRQALKKDTRLINPIESHWRRIKVNIQALSLVGPVFAGFKNPPRQCKDDSTNALKYMIENSIVILKKDW